MCYTSNCSVKFSQIQDRHSWITDVAQFIFTRSQKCIWKVENTHLHNTRTPVLWDKLCHCQPWLFSSQKTLRLLGVQETEAVSYWSEQCDMKLLLPELKHSVVNTSWAACWLDQRCSASVKLTLQHIHGSQLTNETESRRWRANHTILKCSNTLLCHGPAPLLLWQKVDWIALDFFFSLQHVRSVFLGQDQEELGLKRTHSIVKNSFHHQFQHLELHSLQPETEGFRSCGRWSLLPPWQSIWRAAPFIRKISCHSRQCQEVLNELVDLDGVLETD